MTFVNCRSKLIYTVLQPLQVSKPLQVWVGWILSLLGDRDIFPNTWLVALLNSSKCNVSEWSTWVGLVFGWRVIPIHIGVDVCSERRFFNYGKNRTTHIFPYPTLYPLKGQYRVLFLTIQLEFKCFYWALLHFHGWAIFFAPKGPNGSLIPSPGVGLDNIRGHFLILV